MEKVEVVKVLRAMVNDNRNALEVIAGDEDLKKRVVEWSGQENFDDFAGEFMDQLLSFSLLVDLYESETPVG